MTQPHSTNSDLPHSNDQEDQPVVLLPPGSGEDTSTIFTEHPHLIHTNKIVIVNRPIPLRYFSTAGIDAIERVTAALCLEAPQWAGLYKKIFNADPPKNSWFNPAGVRDHLDEIHKSAPDTQQAISEAVEEYNYSVVTLIAASSDSDYENLRGEIVNNYNLYSQKELRHAKQSRTAEALSKLNDRARTGAHIELSAFSLPTSQGPSKPRVNMNTPPPSKTRLGK